MVRILIETKRSSQGHESVSDYLDQPSMSPCAGTAAKAPTLGGRVGGITHSSFSQCKPGPGSLILSKMALSASSKTLMVSRYVCVH